jgi:hypothetical protein
MALTNSFYKAVEDKDLQMIRIMMKDSLLYDRSFKTFKEMEKAASSLSLYEPHDGREFKMDKKDWNDDYMNELMVEVISNFSHERVQHLQEVVRYLRPEHASASNNTQNTDNKKDNNISEKSTKLKNAWDSFTSFINKIIDKFLDSFNENIVAKKGWLEKYKTLILEKDITQSATYTGDYENGLNHCTNFELPVFNWDTHAEKLSENTSQAIIEEIMKGTKFKYVDENDVSLANQFKRYFLGIDDDHNEEIEHSAKELNDKKKDMYDYLLNYSKFINITRKDKELLRRNTKAVQKCIDEQLAKSGRSTANQESGLYAALFSIFTEADDNNKANTGTRLKIGSVYNDKNTSTSKDSVKDGAGNAATSGKSSQDIAKILNKWQEICRVIITARLTAIRKIASDYMKIIEAHVAKNEDTPEPEKTTTD